MGPIVEKWGFKHSQDPLLNLLYSETLIGTKVWIWTVLGIKQWLAHLLSYVYIPSTSLVFIFMVSVRAAP